MLKNHKQSFSRLICGLLGGVLLTTIPLRAERKSLYGDRDGTAAR